MFKIIGFGTFSAIPIAVIITLISFILRLNLIAIETLGKIPFYIWLSGLFLIFLWLFFNNNLNRVMSNRIYSLLAIISFMYWNSMFQWLVDCCPENYESVSEWRTAGSLSWVIHLPTSVFILLVQGVLYDLGRMKYGNK